MAGPAFRGAPVHVRVPATSANLGPGFDCLGLALGIHDELIARIGEDGVVVDVAGEDAEDVARDESNLVIEAMRATFTEFGGQPRGIELSCANRIPHSRGLGSSAAAIVAGVLLARSLVLQGERLLPDAAALDLAARLEGHPDNVAACLSGGLTVAWTPAAVPHRPAVGVRNVRLEVDPSVVPVVFVPPGRSSTSSARGALPSTVPHDDAAFNAGRAALLVAALTGRPELLFDATEDRLHQTYRREVFPPSWELVGGLRSEGVAAVVSGAGPTVLALASGAPAATALLARAPEGWAAQVVTIDTDGAHVVR